MAIQVREMQQEDFEQWQGLYRGYAEFYQVPMNDEILNTVWGWIHDSENPFYGLIAMNSDKAVGLMHCRQMPSPLRGALVGFLDDLFVSPDCRGQGIVEALYEGLDKLGANHGWPFIRWITAENNYRARRVYDGLSDKTHWVTYQMAIKG